MSVAAAIPTLWPGSARVRQIGFSLVSKHSRSHLFNPDGRLDTRMAQASELRTIRALSQYRPFEGGGASVRDAHEDLVLAAFAEAAGSFPSIADAAEAI